MASANNTNGKQVDIDSAGIRELATLMDETGLTEIEVTQGERSIRVSRGGTQHAIAPAHHAPASPVAAPPAAAATPGQAAAPPAGAVKSPMVGTAYLRPEPGAAPFVTAGATVKAGDTLLIIEAMKVMNPIKAAIGGKITQIAVVDAQPVEFGEVLLVIE